MDKEKLLHLVDEEHRLRKRITEHIETKWRLISIIGDTDLCISLIDAAVAAKEAERDHEAILRALLAAIDEQKKEGKDGKVSD